MYCLQSKAAYKQIKHNFIFLVLLIIQTIANMNYASLY